MKSTVRHPSLARLIACFLLATSVVIADEPKLEIVGLSGKKTPSTPVVLHVFSGQPVKIDLSIATAAGSKVDVRATLVQKAGTIAATLQKDVPLGDTVAFDTVTEKRVAVSVPIPKVQRKSVIIAELEMKAAGDWHPAGCATFVVYPPDSLKKELQELVGATHLEVFGNDKRLGPFLEKQEIKTHDIGSDLPNRPEAGLIYVGVAKAAELTQWLNAHPAWEGSLFVFCEDSELLPGAFVEFRGQGCLAKVTLPLLDNIATDPLGQKTFNAILASILNHQTP